MPGKLKTWKTGSGYSITRLLSGRSNVFLVTNGEKNILIDTSIRLLWPKLEKRLHSLNIGRIDYLILTHSHFDHAGNARRIKERFDAKVIIHRDEATNLATGDISVPLGTNFVTRVIVNLLAKSFASKLRCEPCQYDFLADTIFKLDDFGFNAYIVHTPGHSPGSVSVVVDDEIALVGDTMFGVFSGSVFPPYAHDINQMIRSWGTLLETNCEVFLPSHGSANSRSLVQKDYNKRIKKITALPAI